MSSVIYSHLLTSLIIKYLLFRSPVIYLWFNWLFFHRLHSQKKWNIKIPNMQAKKCWQVNKCLKIKNKSQTKNAFVTWNVFRVKAIIYYHIHDNWVVEQKHKKLSLLEQQIFHKTLHSSTMPPWELVQNHMSWIKSSKSKIR